MWTFLVLCSVVFSHTVKGEDRYYTTSNWVPTYSPGQPSCRYNCGRHMGSCSCSSSCQWYGNCCHDFYNYCPSATAYPTTTAATTGQPSCRYNCGRHMGSCSCSSSCQWKGNCCWDYYHYCPQTTSYYPTTAYPTTGQPSCRYNCGRHMGSCSCSSSCQWNGNCCRDYYHYCPQTTSYYPTTAYPTTGQPSCRYNCGRHMGSCSCSSSCQWNGNCCRDYYHYCPQTTSYYPTTAYPTTGQPSCRYNCGRHMGSCSCSSSCQWNGNCCRDYYRYCPSTTAYPTPAYTTTGQPSCRYNCGSHMGSCSCSSSCKRNGNCCRDYYSYCYGTTSFPGTETPCGGSLFSSGTFSSPNHPNHYNDNAYCVWHLSAVNNHRVFLSFMSMQLENCCSCDYISVYDGPSVNSRLLGKVCNESQSTFYSSSKYMTVLFRTDSSVVARGFSADFSSSLSPSSGQVSCSSDMKIVIERSYLSSLGYDGHNLYLNDPNCRPRVTHYQVIFNYPIESCGNVRKIENGKVVYTNVVQAYITTDGEITRKSHFELSVGCRMEQDSVSQIMYLAHHLNNSTMTGIGNFNTSMDFYTSSNFYYKVTQMPYVVTLNQNLYIQVDLKSNESSLVVFLDTCVTSPSPHDFQTRAYYLVRNGCPADSTYGVYSSGSYRYARFTFRSFQFLRASESVYIQCKVRICQSYNSSRCRPTGCNRRKARDLGSEHDSQTLVLGPIQLKEPEKKEEETQSQDKA